jgi:hypothetical protein
VGAVAIEETFGGFSRDHAIRDLVRVLFVGRANLTDAALQLHAAALLDDVSGFVGCRVKVRGTRERDVVPGGVGLRAHRACSRGRLAIRMRFDVDRVASERSLDDVAERQRVRAA